MFGCVHERGQFGNFGAELIGDAAPLGACGLRVVLGKGGGDEGRDHPASTFPGMGQGIAHEVDPAALPRGAKHPGDGGLDALMRVRDHQLDPAQPPARELAQELRPEGFGLGGPDVQTQNLAATVAVDADGDDRSDRDDPVVLAHFYIGRVDPEVGPVPLQRAVEKALHFLVDLFAQPRHLALRNAVHPHRLDQIIDRPRRNSLHIGFLNDRCQRLLGHPARLQKTGKIAALAQLRDAQFHRARPGVPVALAVAVALRQPFGGLLAIARPGQRTNLQRHQTLRRKTDHLPQHVGVRGLLKQGIQAHHRFGHRGSPDQG